MKNREIKFRAWDGKEMEFDIAVGKYGSLAIPEQHVIILDGESTYPPHEPFKALMQYTGLKDKNGVEIYEGDVIQTHLVDDGTLGEVIFADACFKFKWTDGQITIHHKWGVDDIKVIGNIHENPELVKTS